MSTEVREPSAKYFVEAPYKQTDIGEIPSDWSITSLREATDAARPISYGIVQTGPNIDGGVPCIRVVDIDNGRLNTTGLICTSQAISAGYRRTLLQTGDLVMPLRGKVGDVAEVGAELEGANLTRGVALLSIRSGIVGSYCRHALAWSTTRRRLEQAMNGSALQEIPIAALRSFQIALPREEREQRAIASALSDVDALITGLEKLIAKKRDLKQAAMQQLLTGQTRLPGFSGEWVTHPLVALADIATGLNKSTDEMGFGSLYVTVQDLYSGTSIDVDRIGRINASPAEVTANRLEPGDIVFGKSSVKRDGIGYPSQFLGATEPTLFSGFCYRARAKRDTANPIFLFYALRSTPTRRWLIDNSQASALTNINKFIADRIPLVLPPSVEEQTAIAAVLSVMDAELSVLEERREKTLELKQGMMQELLTGRTRLV